MEKLRNLIEELNQQVAAAEGQELEPEAKAWIEAIAKALPLLQQALTVLTATGTSNMVTYKITGDLDGKLKRGARVTCNFWNRFLVPRTSTVIRLGVFTDPGTTIARAYYPYSNGGIVYGRVEFNTKYLAGFTDEETAGTIIHEVGHTLGVGWDDWAALFDPNTGVFTPDAVGKLAALGDMRVELDYGDGTALSHWDEDRFGAELMTGFKDQKEHVLPVTIDVMGLLGHQVVETLGAKTPLADLMKEVAQVVFTRQVEAKALDLDHFQATDIMEVVPHHA